jgi:O-antigen/teichoic acid export membrane protein
MEPDRLAVFMQESILPMKWLVIGVLSISIGLIPSSYLQSTGRPDLIAKVHLIQIPFFLIALYFALDNYGITGVAAVVSIRMILDTLILITLVWRLQAQMGTKLIEELWPMIVSLLFLIIPFWPMSIGLKITTLIFSVFVVTLMIWNFGMRVEEREFIYIKLGKMNPK